MKINFNKIDYSIFNRRAEEVKKHINPFIKIFRDKRIINESLSQGKTLSKIAKENPDIKFVKFDKDFKIIL